MTSNSPPERQAVSVPRKVANAGDEVHLAPRHGEALVRLVETAPSVSRRHQFFIWSQGPLHALLPHQVLVCGAYARPRRALGFTTFQSVVLSSPALSSLADAHSPLMRSCASAWVHGGGRPLSLDVGRLGPEAREPAAQLERELRGLQIVVHGVARPQRTAEIESLFVFLCAPLEERPGERALHAELVMPYLHATWGRVQAAEASIGQAANEPVAAGQPARPGAGSTALTEREREIVRCAREGKSNLEIGLALDISALTVKNHIQKILRKLGASNRAHAVALAMAQGLL